MPRGGRRPGAGRKPKSAVETANNATFEDSRISLNRPLIYMTSISPKREMQASDRITLMKLARWAVNNHGFAARIVRGIARYSVGSGLVPRAKSSNPAWNKMVEELFEDRVCNEPFAFDKSGQVNFYEAQKIVLEQVATDGDFFGQQVESANGSAMMRFFGAEHVNSLRTDDSDEKWQDGVRLNGDNRPVAYRVILDPEKASSRSITLSASDVRHYRRIHRYGYARGVSWLCSSVSRFQDWREMMENEQASAKLNSKIALTIESPEAENIGLGSRLRKSFDATGRENIIDELAPGSGSVALKPGEKLIAHEFNRPNVNFEKWVDFLSREISWGIGLSPEILWAIAGVGGPQTRYVLQDAETFFGEMRQMLEYQFCRPFWTYWLWREIESGRVPYPGKDWFRVDFIPPQRLTIDTGRDGKLRLDLVRAGLLSRTRYFDELGQDDAAETDDAIRSYLRAKKRVAEIAKEEGVEATVQEVFTPPPGAAPVQISGDQPDEEN
jgi:lambda family phage portal protein